MIIEVSINKNTALFLIVLKYKKLSNGNPRIMSSQKHTFIKKNQFEKTAWQENTLVCGIDEAGRGCLAGPLVVAAVMLPHNTRETTLKDSKKMTAVQRETAFKWIVDNAWYGISILNNRLIDKHNIWQTTLQGMERALYQLNAITPSPPSAILVDAMPLTINFGPLSTIPLHYFCYGEDHSISIAAASIVAKITRDKIMSNMHKSLPHYLFNQHKGYGTAAHRSTIIIHQPSLIHRKSFLTNILNARENNGIQQSLC